MGTSHVISTHVVHIFPPSAVMLSTLLVQPGEYDVTLLVGDASAKGVEYLLGTAELRFSAASTAPEPRAAVRTASFQPLNNLKPEIRHIFVSTFRSTFRWKEGGWARKM